MAASAIDRRLATEVVTRWGLSRQDAVEIVRHVLEEVVRDLRRAEAVVAVADPDLAMGVRLAVARLTLSAAKLGERRAGGR